MIAVIFIAEVKKLPQTYFDLAKEVRALAENMGARILFQCQKKGRRFPFLIGILKIKLFSGGKIHCISRLSNWDENIGINRIRFR